MSGIEGKFDEGPRVRGSWGPCSEPEAEPRPQAAPCSVVSQPSVYYRSFQVMDGDGGWSSEWGW